MVSVSCSVIPHCQRRVCHGDASSQTLKDQNEETPVPDFDLRSDPVRWRPFANVSPTRLCAGTNAATAARHATASRYAGHGAVGADGHVGEHCLCRGARHTDRRFNQAYLGPTILVQNGELAAEVQNALDEPISTHWHGLLVPGEYDGGPHLAIAPGATWRPEMSIAQDPATAWYHSHIHEQTAEQVYFGLAGVIHVTDGQDDARVCRPHMASTI